MKHVLFVLLLNLSVCAVAQAQVSPDAEQAAASIYASFFDAMTKVEMDKVIGLFTDDAQFWGTTTTTLATDISGVATYFGALRGNQPGQNIFRPIDHSVLALNADTLLVAGRWEAGPATGTTFTKLRMSLVLVRREGVWKIAQFHNSRLPE